MILVVDDFRDGGEALCRLLKQRGYPCQYVSNGPEALAQLRSHPAEQPLLLVLDEMMPVMSGLEVLRAIRADPQIRSTCVIVFTAGFDIAKREEAITLGVAAWLLKGTDFEQIMKTVGEWYERLGGVCSTRRESSRKNDAGE